MSTEHWWNDNDRGKQSTQRNTCASANPSSRKLTWVGLVLNMGCHGERLAAKQFSHGTRFFEILLNIGEKDKRQDRQNKGVIIMRLCLVLVWRGTWREQSGQCLDTECGSTCVEQHSAGRVDSVWIRGVAPHVLNCTVQGEWTVSGHRVWLHNSTVQGEWTVSGYGVWLHMC